MLKWQCFTSWCWIFCSLKATKIKFIRLLNLLQPRQSPQKDFATFNPKNNAALQDSPLTLWWLHITAGSVDQIWFSITILPCDNYENKIIKIKKNIILPQSISQCCLLRTVAVPQLCTNKLEESLSIWQIAVRVLALYRQWYVCVCTTCPELTVCL